MVRDKLSNAIREYREIVQKDRLKNYWERKVGPAHYAIHSWALHQPLREAQRCAAKAFIVMLHNAAPLPDIVLKSDSLPLRAMC